MLFTFEVHCVCMRAYVCMCVCVCIQTVQITMIMMLPALLKTLVIYITAHIPGLSLTNTPAVIHAQVYYILCDLHNVFVNSTIVSSSKVSPELATLLIRSDQLTTPV